MTRNSGQSDEQPNIKYGRWALWQVEGDLIIFDMIDNIPYDPADQSERERMVRLLEDAGVVAQRDYPGRPCN